MAFASCIFIELNNERMCLVNVKIEWTLARLLDLAIWYCRLRSQKVVIKFCYKHEKIKTK